MKIILLKAGDCSFSDQLETGILDFIDECLFSRSYMTECPLARGAWDAFKVDQDNPSTIRECMLDGFHGLLWKFKVVVKIANQGKVNATGR